MDIITVCGLGVGSSLIMKMTVQKACDELGIDANIEHWDMGTVNSKKCDLIVTTEEFRKNFSDVDNVIFLTNMVDKKEAKQKLEEYLSNKNS